MELEVGAVILTLGSQPYDPSQEDVYHYASQPNVVTSLEIRAHALGHRPHRRVIWHKAQRRHRSRPR